MGISNQLPSSRISQAGVIPNAAARPASPYEGQVIYETDTNRVLVYDNSAWVMVLDTDQPPGLQLIKSQTVGTAVPSVEVTDAFSSDFDNYYITWVGGSGSTGMNTRLRLGSNTTNYYSSLIYHVFSSASTLVGVSQNNTQTQWEWAGACSTTSINVSLTLLGPFLNENTRMIANWTPPDASGTSNSLLLDTNSYTSFTFLPGVTGTFTGGTIRVYGYRN